jgi:hypothetical protein
MKIDGTLRKQASGAWAIQAAGREPVPIGTGEVFMVEVVPRWLRFGRFVNDGRVCAARPKILSLTNRAPRYA